MSNFTFTCTIFVFVIFVFVILLYFTTCIYFEQYSGFNICNYKAKFLEAVIFIFQLQIYQCANLLPAIIYAKLQLEKLPAVAELDLNWVMIRKLVKVIEPLSHLAVMISPGPVSRQNLIEFMNLFMGNLCWFKCLMETHILQVSLRFQRKNILQISKIFVFLDNGKEIWVLKPRQRACHLNLPVTQSKFPADLNDTSTVYLFYCHSDINECQRRIDSCEDVCYNTMGSYICDCTKEGFKLSYDLHSCEGNR